MSNGTLVISEIYRRLVVENASGTCSLADLIVVAGADAVLPLPQHLGNSWTSGGTNRTMISEDSEKLLLEMRN
jgi:hypothetical protein